MFFEMSCLLQVPERGPRIYGSLPRGVIIGGYPYRKLSLRETVMVILKTVRSSLRAIWRCPALGFRCEADILAINSYHALVLLGEDIMRLLPTADTRRGLCAASSRPNAAKVFGINYAVKMSKVATTTFMYPFQFQISTCLQCNATSAV